MTEKQAPLFPPATPVAFATSTSAAIEARGEPRELPPPPVKTWLESFVVTCQVCGLRSVLVEIGVPTKNEESYAVILTCTGCKNEERVSG